MIINKNFPHGSDPRMQAENFDNTTNKYVNSLVAFDIASPRCRQHYDIKTSQSGSKLFLFLIHSFYVVGASPKNNGHGFFSTKRKYFTLELLLLILNIKSTENF